MLTMVITLPVLVGLTVVGVATADQRLTTPLFVALAACTLVATFFTVDVSPQVFFDASLVPAMLASVFAGPAAAGALTLVAEAGTMLNKRHRARAAAINLASICGPIMVWAVVAPEIWGEAGTVGWYLVLVTFPIFTAMLNIAIVYRGFGLLDGPLDGDPVAAFKQVLPAIAINAVLGVAAAAVYRSSGLGALVFVLASIAVFAYLAGQTARARERNCELERLAASRARLASQVIAVEEAERLRLANALHDQAIQNLLAVRQDLGEASAAGEVHLSAARSAVEATVAQLREAVFELRPAALDELGLVQAVERVATEQAARGNVRVSVTASAEDFLARDVEELVFSLARELMTNVARHSAASSATVLLSARNSLATLEVQDDGIGFAPGRLAAAADDGHFGLRAARERVQSAGGSLVVASSPRGGTSVRVQLPLRELDSSHRKGWRAVRGRLRLASSAKPL